MATPIVLEVNHVEMSDQMTWGISTEEVLGGAGRATIIVQDRTNSWEPKAHWDVKVYIRSSGFVLYRGEIIREPMDFPPLPWRIWKLECSDYNNEFEKRLIGALDGKTWMDVSGLGVFQNIDPFSAALDTDKLTVQQWLDHYIRVDGQAFDTATYVQEYLTNIWPRSWYYSTLQQGLEELAAMIAANLQFWADPELKFHWVAIPAWQDLATQGVDILTDETLSEMALMAPEGSVGGFSFAPYDVVEPSAGLGAGDIGFKSLSIDPDGSDMPEQIYVRGSTGYVYNAPALTGTENKTVVTSPTAGTADHYEAVINSTTKVWHTDATGYVSTSYDLASAGGPYTVKWVRIAWNEARNKGGNYWKMLDGPYAGKLLDDNTNVLNGYGSITVYKVAADPGSPVIGTGGSGWVNEDTQDPNKRQAFFDAPISSDKATRDSLGNTLLNRAKYETLRGHFKAVGYDGWRAGQLVNITDSRLPAGMSGKWYVIQRVATKLLAGTDVREYDIDFGDGPTSRYTYQKQPGPVNWPEPAMMIWVEAHDLSPGPNSTQTITAQMVNGSGEPWAIEGKTVNWSFECYNRLGQLQVGQGSISPTVSVTDRYGKARTRLTTGSGTNLVYFVFANVKAT